MYTTRAHGIISKYLGCVNKFPNACHLKIIVMYSLVNFIAEASKIMAQSVT